MALPTDLLHTPSNIATIDKSGRGRPVSGQSLVYRLRAMEMLRRRISGAKLKDIAVQYNCSPATVANAIAWAMREGLVQQYENDLVNGLVPKAMQVYAAKMDDPDDPDAVGVAKDVLNMMMKLGDRFQAKESTKEEMGLRQYLATKRYGKPTQPTPQPTPGRLRSGSHAVIDVPGDPPTHLSSDDPPVFAAGYVGDLADAADTFDEETTEALLGTAHGQTRLPRAPTHALTPTDPSDEAVLADIDGNDGEG